MQQASSRYIYLYHFAGLTSWDRQWQELWQKLHNRAYQPGPKSDVLYNVLYQMGIYPSVSAFRLEHNQPYASLDEAVAALAPQAQAESEEQKAVLREYLRGALRAGGRDAGDAGLVGEGEDVVGEGKGRVNAEGVPISFQF